MFGILDTQYIDLPDGTDAEYLRGLETRSGVSFDSILTQLDGRLGALNASLDPLLSAVMFVTDQITVDQTDSDIFEVSESGEYAVPRPQFAEGLPGMMVPLRKWDVSTSWTEDGLNQMSLRSINRQFDAIMRGFRRRYRREILSRLFAIEEIRVDRRTTATNPGFAGSGTGENVFLSPFPDGNELPAGYSHYVRDVVANRAAAIKTQRDKLAKWNSGNFDLVGTQNFIDAITADTVNFVQAGSTLIRVGPDQAEANVDPELYLGVFDRNIRVRHPIEDVAGDYAVVFKTFGSLAEGNPLAWRFDPLYGRNAFLRSRSMYPLDQAIVIQRFGIGVANRVTAAPIQIDAAAGAYVTPTIS